MFHIGSYGYWAERGGVRPAACRYELPESERICSHDGSVLVEIGVEVSEQLDTIPQQVRVIRHERVKYACPRCDESPKVTPARTRIIPKGLFTEAALAG